MAGTASSVGLDFLPLSATNSQLYPSFFFSPYIIHVTILPFPPAFSVCHATSSVCFFLILPSFSIYPQFFPPLLLSPLPLPYTPPLLPPLLFPAELQPSSCSPLRIFTRAVLPTIRTHYCQLCHLRPPERQKKRRGGDGTVPVEVGRVCVRRGGGVLYSFLDTATKRCV